MRPQQIIVARRRKNPVIAIVLTVLFGSLGLLYVSILGGIVLFAAAVISILNGFSAGVFIVWGISVLWGVFATTNLRRIFD